MSGHGVGNDVGVVAQARGRWWVAILAIVCHRTGGARHAHVWLVVVLVGHGWLRWVVVGLVLVLVRRHTSHRGDPCCGSRAGHRHGHGRLVGLGAENVVIAIVLGRVVAMS